MSETKFNENPDLWAKEKIASILEKKGYENSNVVDVIRGLTSEDFEEIRKRKRENFKKLLLEVCEEQEHEVENALFSYTGIFIYDDFVEAAAVKLFDSGQVN